MSRPGHSQMVGMYRHLLPDFYVQKVAGQQKLEEKRHELQQTADRLLGSWRARDGPFAGLDEDTQAWLEGTALSCIEWFVHASSQVEGRDARLGWNHQSFRGLIPRKLKALTVIHNYFLQRADETSATERLFAQKPNDLFEYLVETLPKPRRPAAKRSKQAA